MAEELDWKKLRTPFGPATKIPKLVKSMSTSKDIREEVRWESFRELRALLIDGASCTSASSKTIELILDYRAKAVEFDYSLWLIAEIVAKDTFRAWLTRTLSAVDTDEEYQSCLRLIESHQDVVIAYLTSAKPAERAAAAVLLGVVPSLSKHSIPALEKQLTDERVGLTRASILLALDLLDRSGKWQREIERIAKEGDTDPLVWSAATLSWLRDSGEHSCRDAVGGLGALLGRVTLKGFEYFGWFQLSHLGEQVRVLTRVLESSHANAREDVLDAVVLVGQSCQEPTGISNVTWALNQLLKRPDRKTPDRVINADKLDPELLRVAHGLKDTMVYPEPRWLPAPGNCRRRWLGIEPPSALEKLVAIPSAAEAKPVWQHLLERDPKTSKAEVLPRQLEESLTTEERWRVVVEMRAYGCGSYSNWDALYEYGAAITVTDDLERTIHRCCGEVMQRERAKGKEHELGNAAVTRLMFLPLVRGRRKIPEELFPLVSLWDTPQEREVMASLSKEQLGELIRGELDSASAVTADSIATAMLKILDMAPTPAACDALVRVANRWLSDAEQQQDFHKQYRAALESIPELKAAAQRATAQPVDTPDKKGGAPRKPGRK